MMNALVIKVLAVGLTLSQLFTQPLENFKSRFDPVADQAQVNQLLGAGCKFMIKEFEAEDMDFDFLFTMLIGTAEEQKAAAAKASAAAGQETFTDKLMKQVDLPALYATYKQFCKGEVTEGHALNLTEVINYYNQSIGELPDHSRLKGLKLPETSILLDQNDQKFTEVYSDDNRRKWVPIAELPDHVKKAFVAAEDKRFFEHNGLDIRGIVRAFSSNLSGEGRPQGGSTITQQVVKNLLVGDDLTFERKMREMVLATRVEKLLSKEEILELYLNYVFLGRASWGVEMAAQSYFGKSARQLSHEEAAFLAGLTKGPNYYHPDRHPERALERREYVLGRMRDDKYISETDFETANKKPMQLIPYDPPRTKGGFFFIDEINRQVKRSLGIPSLTSASYTVYSTLHPQLQVDTDRALQDGLSAYETQSGRAAFKGPEGSLADDIAKYKKSWQEILPTVRPRLFDVQWPLAVVVEKTSKGAKVGLADGRTVALKAHARALNLLKVYDLIHVNIVEEKGKARAELKIPSVVQGAVVVLENRTGKVLAMSGGFSYAQSQLNRVTQTTRQTGSTLKPFIYLSALNLGYQPNTLIPDSSISFPPINKGGDRWRPKNYSGRSNMLVTIRQAVEKSLNLPTARIMASMGSPGNPGEGLDYVQGVAKELGIYKTTERYYSWVLGAQPARLMDLAVAYATVANDGLKPTPQFVDKLVKDNQIVYERPRFSLVPLPSVDRVAFYQLRRILEGTVMRGTATRIKRWAGSVAGKTGTSNNENDAWFVGFTKDITVAVWVGYDSRNIRSNLGGQFTGGRVALPIAEAVFESSFKSFKPLEPLGPAPAEIQPQIFEAPVDKRNPNAGVDVFRIDRQSGLVAETRNSLLTPDEYAMSEYYDWEEPAVDDQAFEVGADEYLEPQTEATDAQDYYQPGAEDMQDLYRSRNRQVDPFFTEPIFFKLGEP